ncbi:MAG: hypothetical protein DRQ97_14115 [Gammaproteobacteria bacterium]|nr:MAG: hypothetical protein DRQ97_14115 [Gammaproteobacteria bacterium]
MITDFLSARIFLNWVLVILLCTIGVGHAYPQQDEETILEVAVVDAAPYGFAVSEGFFEGIMVDLWREVAEDLGMRYNFTLIDIDEALSGVREGTFDLAIGAITVTPERETMVDFSHGVTPSGIVTVVAKDHIHGKFETYYKPILLSLLKIVLILSTFMLASATIVWLLERKHRFHEREKQIRHLGDGIWWSAVTISTVGYGDKVPHTTLGRVVGIAWIFVGVTMVSLFTANAAAILSRPTVALTVTFQDLKKMDFAALDNSAASEYFDRHQMDYTGYDDIDEAIQDIRDRKTEALVGDAKVIRYLADEVYPGDLIISDNVLLMDYLAFAFQERSPLIEIVNVALLKHINEPRWQKTLFSPIHKEN